MNNFMFNMSGSDLSLLPISDQIIALNLQLKVIAGKQVNSDKSFADQITAVNEKIQQLSTPVQA
jgi:hypothetical protein